MTEQELNDLNAANNQAIVDGKPPLIEVLKPEQILNNPKQNPETSPIDEFLPALVELRRVRFAKIATKTLTVASGSLSVAFNPRRHLLVRIRITGKSANTPVNLQFNNDAGTNYLYNVTANNPSAASILLDNISSSDDIFSTLDITNVKDLGKMMLYQTMRWSGTAGGSSTVINGIGAWDNKTSQITSIQLSSSGVVTFGPGSQIDIYGLD